MCKQKNTPKAAQTATNPSGEAQAAQLMETLTEWVATVDGVVKDSPNDYCVIDTLAQGFGDGPTPKAFVGTGLENNNAALVFATALFPDLLKSRGWHDDEDWNSYCENAFIILRVALCAEFAEKKNKSRKYGVTALMQTAATVVDRLLDEAEAENGAETLAHTCATEGATNG